MIFNIMKSNIYLEAPNYLKPGEIKDWERTVFLAGSISNARNWQIEAKEKLLSHFHVFNPRRENYNNFDPNEERTQITWEFNHINLSTIILFYFSEETLAPITLWECARAIENAKYTPWKRIYICIHPNYKRKNDIIIQTELINPNIARNIFFNLEGMCNKIIQEN